MIYNAYVKVRGTYMSLDYMLYKQVRIYVYMLIGPYTYICIYMLR